MAMTLRLTEEQTRALRETAERERRSMQDVARSAVDEYVNRRTQRRDDALRRIGVEDHKLFERLGEA